MGSLTVAFFLLLLPDMKDFLSLERQHMHMESVKRAYGLNSGGGTGQGPPPEAQFIILAAVGPQLEQLGS